MVGKVAASQTPEAQLPKNTALAVTQTDWLTDLSKWLKAATTVSLTNPNEADTVANQLTTAPRMSRNSVGRKQGGIQQYTAVYHICITAVSVVPPYLSIMMCLPTSNYKTFKWFRTFIYARRASRPWPCRTYFEPTSQVSQSCSQPWARDNQMQYVRVSIYVHIILCCMYLCSMRDNQCNLWCIIHILFRTPIQRCTTR